ncbi:hypothetical protein, partial [Brevibacillus gelatini]|uniref:hypothetical protein n=1 Tax=Brevibacillus gelatini TaxID=1655277 RepID=UPI001B879FEB
SLFSFQGAFTDCLSAEYSSFFVMASQGQELIYHVTRIRVNSFFQKVLGEVFLAQFSASHVLGKLTGRGYSGIHAEHDGVAFFHSALHQRVDSFIAKVEQHFFEFPFQ